MSNLPPMKSPPSVDLFGLRWEVTRHPLRFGVSDGCRGVGGSRTPLGAYLALRKWRKEVPTPRETFAESRGWHLSDEERLRRAGIAKANET